jgi:hypothetical protein
MPRRHCCSTTGLRRDQYYRLALLVHYQLTTNRSRNTLDAYAAVHQWWTSTVVQNNRYYRQDYWYYRLVLRCNDFSAGPSPCNPLILYFIPKVPLGHACLYIAPPIHLETLELI